MENKIDKFLSVIGLITWFIGVTTLIAVIGVSIWSYKNGNNKIELSVYTNDRFVELEAWDEKSLTGLAYDKYTEIIYMFTTIDGIRQYTPYYVLNEDDEPVIGVYDGSELMEWDNIQYEDNFDN